MEEQTVTTEDDFQRLIDRKSDDWHTRLVLADWLEDRGDPRSGGYRAIAIQKRRPLQGRHRDIDTWWWHRSGSTKIEDFHNHIPQDWFSLLPAGEGSESFWPVFSPKGGIKSRRECEDALALAFSLLSPERQAELMIPPIHLESEKTRKAKKANGKKPKKEGDSE